MARCEAMMKLATALFVWLLLCGGIAVAQQRVDLQPRPGVTQPIYLTPVNSPKASVILFPGGNGIVEQVRNNFLLRVAPRFAAAGMTVAVFDAPSDQRSGTSSQFRASAEHAKDIAAVVDWLK